MLDKYNARIYTQITYVPLSHLHVLQELRVKKADGAPISRVGSNSTGCRRKMQLGLTLNWTLVCTICTYADSDSCTATKERG